MNSERISGQPGQDAANASPERGTSRDQVEYRGPLKDPTKLPVEEAVRPPPVPQPWGVQGDGLLLAEYLQALREMVGRTPQFLSRLIESSPYLAQIESAQGYAEATAELVLHRRVERRWLKSFLGKREFVRRRRQGKLHNLFGWPRTSPKGGPQRITVESKPTSRDSGFPPSDQG